MRLIDADKLHYIRKWFEDSGKSEAVVFAKEIDKAPTVQAIPVEHIYRRATEFSKMYSDKDLFTAKEIGLALVLIVRDWEVENDKNI